MRFRLLLEFVLLASCLTVAQSMPMPLGSRNSRESSRSVVGSYCRMDYDGSRLVKDSWARMQQLTTWKDNPDWQGFTVVSQYEVLSISDGARSSSVEVGYNVLGRFERGIGYTAERAREVVAFRLRSVGSEWKVDELDPPIDPHVSKVRAIAWLKASLIAEKDAGNRIALETALKKLGGTP